MCKRVIICEPLWTKIDNVIGPVKTNDGDMFFLKNSNEYFWARNISQLGEDLKDITGFERLMKISCVLEKNPVSADEIKEYILQNEQMRDL